MNPKVERRRATRFRLSFSVRWSSTDLGLNSRLCTGETRDISAGGLFITSTECPIIGTDLSLEIQVPVRDHLAPKMRLQGVGRVVRSADKSGPKGFAVQGLKSWSIGRLRSASALVSVQVPVS